MKKRIIVLFICFTLILISQIVFAGEIKDNLLETMNKTPASEKIHAIMLFNETPDSSDITTIKSYGANIKYQYKIVNAVAIKANQKVITNLAKMKSVKLIEPDYRIEIVLDKSASQIRAMEVWKSNFTGKNIDISVIDTGIHDEHPSLFVMKEIDYTGEGTDDLNGHGTHVAGIIASTDSVYRGIAYDSNLFNAKALNKDGYGYASDVIRAIEWSVDNGAEIISMSFGADVDPCDGTDILSQATDNAVGNGVIVVVAAGNSGPNVGTITSPGCSRDAITVGAVDGDDNIASFSSRGPTDDGRVKPDLVAPGVLITSTWIDGFRSLSGTSMSTPHVSGVAALLLEADSSLKPYDMKNVLKSATVDLGLDENMQGDGRVDAYKAMLSLINVSDIHIIEFSSDKITVNISETFTLSLTVGNIGDIDAEGVVAILDIPEGLTSLDNIIKDLTTEGEENGVISPESKAYVSWTILSDKKGDYEIRANVSSENAGFDFFTVIIKVESEKDEPRLSKRNRTNFFPPSLFKNKTIGPDSLYFYMFKRVFEKIDMGLTFDEVKRAEKYMNYAAERLAEAQMLNGENPEFIERLMEEYQSNLENADIEIKVAKELGKNTEEIENMAETISSKYTEILSETIEEIPENTKSVVEEAIVISNKERGDADKEIIPKPEPSVPSPKPHENIPAVSVPIGTDADSTGIAHGVENTGGGSSAYGSGTTSSGVGVGSSSSGSAASVPGVSGYAHDKGITGHILKIIKTFLYSPTNN